MKEIETKRKENVELQAEIKGMTFKLYELSKEADGLKASLLKFSKVKDTLNTCLPNPASEANNT